MRATLTASRLSSHFPQTLQAQSADQATVDAVFTAFSHEALNFRNLFAMSAASAGFTLVRASARSLLPMVPGAFFLSSAAGLVAEVGLYRIVNDRENWQNRSDFTRDLISFSCLKGFSFFFKSQNFFTQHSISALGMLSGGYAAESLHLAESSGKNFSQRLSHALATSLALDCGVRVFKIASGAHIQSIESKLHATLQIRESASKPIATRPLSQMATNASTVVESYSLNMQIAHGVEACELGKNEISDPTITRKTHSILGRNIKTREYFLLPVISRPSAKDWKEAILNGATESEIYSQCWHKDNAGEWRIMPANHRTPLQLGEEFALGDVRVRITEDANGQAILERLQNIRVDSAAIPPPDKRWIDGPLTRIGRQVVMPLIPEGIIREHLRGAQTQGERFSDVNIAAETWRSHEHSNEDRFFIYRCPRTGRTILAAIDGLGGHAGGARAAVVIRLTLEWACRNGLNIDEAIELSQRTLVRDNWAQGMLRCKAYIDSELAMRSSSTLSSAVKRSLRHQIFREFLSQPDGMCFHSGAVITIGEFQKNARAHFDGRILSLGDAEFHLLAPHLPESEVVQDWTLKPVTIYTPSKEAVFQQRRRSDGSIHPEDLILARLHPNANIIETNIGGVFRPQVKTLRDIPKGFVVLLSSDGFSENYGHFHEIGKIAYNAYQAGSRTAAEYLKAFVEDSKIRTHLLRDSNKRKYWTRSPRFSFQTFILSKGAAARAYRRIHGFAPPPAWQWSYQTSHREQNPFTIWDQEICRYRDILAIREARTQPMTLNLAQRQDTLREKVLSHIKGNDDQTVVVFTLE